LKTGQRYTTQQNYKYLLKIIQESEFGKLQLKSVKASTIKKFYVELKDKGYSYAVISRLHCHIKQAFAQAVEDDVLRKNPAMFKFKSIIQDDGEKVKGLTNEEQKKVSDFIQSHGDFRKHCDDYTILLGTGVRISELCGITIDDVDFQSHSINIDKQLKRKSDGTLYIERTKTKAGRRQIPMSPQVEIAFKNVIKARKSYDIEWIVDGVSKFVFLNRDGRPKTATTFDKEFSHIQNAYNQKYHTNLKITPHVLRHSFCTNMVNSGMNIKSVQYMTGHASAKILLDVYTDSDPKTVLKEFHEAVANGYI